MENMSTIRNYNRHQRQISSIRGDGYLSTLEGQQLCFL
jgi:hypothetical protein